MAVISAHRGKVYMDITVGATATTDISGGCTAWTLDINKTVGTHFNLGSDWQQATVGGIAVTGSISAVTDTTAATAWGYLTTAVSEASSVASRTLELYKPDATTGSNKWAGEAFFTGGTNMAATAGSGDGDVGTFAFVGTGTWTKSTVA